MATLGPAIGGPLGMKPDSGGNSTDGSKILLNTYIHNYFVGEGLHDLAKSLRSSRLIFKEEHLSIQDGTDGDKDGNANRGDGGAMPGGAGSENFLPNWWCIFLDMWSAARNKGKSDSATAQYLEHTQRLRQQTQNVMHMGQPMIGNNFARFTNPMQSQAADLNRKAMLNNGRLPASMNNIRMQQMNLQNQGQRDGPDMDMNGAPRGQSPMPGDAPSPKRQRVDNGSFNPHNSQMGPNGRTQGMPGQPPNGSAPNAPMLIAAGYDPSNAMSPNFGSNGLPKSAQQLYSQEMANQTRNAMHGTPKGPMGIPGMPQGSPMIPTGPDGQMLPVDFINGGAAMRGNMAPTGNGGALADYQMQLMLLEQQNKKRLMMARQEQDVAQRDQGPQGIMGQPGFAPPMSPRTSRAGHSPGSNDMTKRGTPKLGQDSPLPDGTMRNSPIPNGFEQQMGPNGMVPGFSMVGGPNGMMVRPNQHPGGPMNPQLEMIRQQQGMRMGNGAWPPGMPSPGQMMPQGQGMMQPNQLDNNPQRSNMPPPQGPANGRTQPPSPPPPNAAPPTPSQGKAAAPKKQNIKDKPKKATKKQGTIGGAPPGEVEQIEDTVPPTPSTPVSKDANIIKGPRPGQQNTNMPPQQPQPPVQPSGGMNMGGPPDNSMVAPFSSMNDAGDMPNFEFDDILAQDTTDVLHGFDFDAFLHNDPVPGFDFGDATYMNGDAALEGLGD